MFKHMRQCAASATSEFDPDLSLSQLTPAAITPLAHSRNLIFLKEKVDVW
jgi:hypothetical protein